MVWVKEEGRITSLIYKLIVSLLRKIGTYDKRNVSYSTIVSSSINDGGNKTFLDIGVGTGQISNMLCQNKERFIAGLDICRHILKSNRRRLFHPVVADAHHMPFRNEIFDVTLFISCVEHLAQPSGCIKEISRITKQNGICITQLPNLQWLMEPHTKFPLLYFLPQRFSSVIKKSSGYESINLRITLKKVLSWFDTFGFTNIDRRNIHHFQIFRFPWWPLGWFLTFRKTARADRITPILTPTVNRRSL